MEFCKTEQRFTGIPCQGLPKGHDGDHNWPPSNDPRLRRKTPVEDLPLDEKIEIIAEAMRHDCEVMMNFLLDQDDTYALDRAAEHARGDTSRGFKIFGWRAS